jgi:hypothetical protein
MRIPKKGAMRPAIAANDLLDTGVHILKLGGEAAASTRSSPSSAISTPASGYATSTIPIALAKSAISLPLVIAANWRTRVFGKRSLRGLLAAAPRHAGALGSGPKADA